MEIKKKPEAQLENYSVLFLQLGLVLSLFCVYVVLEHKTYEKTIADFDTVELTETEDEVLVITHRTPPPVAPPPPPPPTTEIVEIVEDTKEIEETIIESTETDEEEAVEATIDLDDIHEAVEGEEFVEDVPFAVIEDVPVFPGCKGTKEELKACLSKKISKHVNRKFNGQLASDLGLSEGKKRIFVMFTINQHGKISEIQARAPHPRLQKEAERVVKTLPDMTPGKQRGIPVRVKYALPITFEVVND